MKKCISCGQNIPDEASFCLMCCTPQIEKKVPEIPAPKKKRPVLIAILAAIAVVAVILAVVFLTGPKTYDTGTASVSWNNSGTSWKVLLRNTSSDLFHWKTPQDTYERFLIQGENAAIPLQLYVYDETTGENILDAFASAVSSMKVTAIPAEGSQAMECSEPAYKEGFPQAVYVSDVLYDTTCTSNEIIWQLNMKNGDTLILHEKAEVGTRPEATYSYETTSLETTEEVQALIDQVQTELSPEAAVTITLAPVVYEGDIHLAGRQISLNGTVDGDDRTIIKGKLTLEAAGSTAISLPTYQGILFESEDSGIEATDAFFATACEFNGCKIGVNTEEGCWAMPYDCVFTDCGTGLLFNSSTSTVQNVYFSGLTFKNNDTAIRLEKVPSDGVLYFVDCTFEGNGTDMDNIAGNRISYTLEGL